MQHLPRTHWNGNWWKSYMYDCHTNKCSCCSGSCWNQLGWRTSSPYNCFSIPWTLLFFRENLSKDLRATPNFNSLRANSKALPFPACKGKLPLGRGTYISGAYGNCIRKRWIQKHVFFNGNVGMTFKYWISCPSSIFCRLHWNGWSPTSSQHVTSCPKLKGLLGLRGAAIKRELAGQFAKHNLLGECYTIRNSFHQGWIVGSLLEQFLYTLEN